MIDFAFNANGKAPLLGGVLSGCALPPADPDRNS